MERSITPGRAPPTFKRISCRALPIVALAWCPWPKQLDEKLISISFRIGPLNITIGAQECVVAKLPCKLYSGSRTARAAAKTAGNYSGRQPAITAFAASVSKVGITSRGVIGGNGSLSPRTNSTKRPTTSSVGITKGKPSLHPCPIAYSFHCPGSISPRSMISVSLSIVTVTRKAMPEPPCHAIMENVKTVLEFDTHFFEHDNSGKLNRLTPSHGSIGDLSL